MTAMTATLQAIANRSPLRQARIVVALQNECSKLLGQPPEEIDSDVTFLALGADSLVLLRISQTLKDLFGIKVPFRRLLSDLGTIESLAVHVDRSMFPGLAHAGNGESDAGTVAADTQSIMSDTGRRRSAMERIFAQQLRIMSMQIDLLRSQCAAGEPSRIEMSSVSEGISQVENVSDSADGFDRDTSNPEVIGPQEPACDDSTFENLVSEIQALTPEQVRIAIENEREIQQTES